jgi:hypothetical protein
VSEKRLLRLSKPKKEEITRSWRKLYNAELHKLYSPSILRAIKRKDEMGRRYDMLGRKD